MGYRAKDLFIYLYIFPSSEILIRILPVLTHEYEIKRKHPLRILSAEIIALDIESSLEESFPYILRTVSFFTLLV